MHGHTRTQPSLPWQGLSQPAAQSSYEAAVRASETAAQRCEELRRYLRRRGYFGATDAEIERDLRWRPNVVTARRNDLVTNGEVVVRWPHSRRASCRRSPGREPLRITIWILSECIRAEVA